MMMTAAVLIVTLLGGAGALKIGHPVDRKLLTVRMAGIDNDPDGDVNEEWKDKDVTVNHLAKCGGRFVREVLSRTIKDGHLKIERENQGLSEQDTTKTFTIGLIRNPFEYYLSLWSFTSGRRGTGKGLVTAFNNKQKDELFCTKKPCGSDPEDVKRFHKFVKTINHHSLGLMSMRFHGSYLQKFGTRLRPDWQTSFATKVRPQKLAKVQKELEKFETMTGPVACWVRTEHLVPNLRSCLELYDSTAAQGTHRVDWKEFEVATQEAKHNKADHVECSKVYTDELYDDVAESDQHILRAFDYDKKCHS